MRKIDHRGRPQSHAVVRPGDGDGADLAIQAHSPAAAAGVEPGGTIRTLDGKPIADPMTLPELFHDRRGRDIVLGVEYPGKGVKEFRLAVGARRIHGAAERGQSDDDLLAGNRLSSAQSRARGGPRLAGGEGRPPQRRRTRQGGPPAPRRRRPKPAPQGLQATGPQVSRRTNSPSMRSIATGPASCAPSSGACPEPRSNCNGSAARRP